MDEQARIAELELEIARLRAQLSERAIPPLHDDPGVARLLGNRALLANLPDIIAVLDRQHRILYINRVVPPHTVEDLLGRCIFDFIREDEREPRRLALERAWETGEVQTIESHGVSGSVWNTRNVPIVENGRVTYMLTTGLDVTERRRAEEALRESESRLRHAIEATGMGTWYRDGDTLRWDETLCRILGIQPSQVPEGADAYLQVIHPEDRARVAALIERARTTGTYEDVECRIVRPDGSIRHVRARGTPVRDEAGRTIRSYGGIIDITEQKLLEEHVQQSQKMEAVGQLTAGIAHNFNNILGVILPSVELCRREAPPSIAARLDDIAHAAERGAEMIRQLMLFTRRNVAVSKAPVDLAECARRTAEICRTTFDPGIAITVSVDSAVPCALANAGQIEQVLLNICLNARDAIALAGTPNPQIAINVDAPSFELVRVRVTDNGPGMSEATRARIFEPFFTTKSVERGTGLGLASAYAIVTDHQGLITCESRLGEGTTFLIELPSTCARPSEVRESETPVRHGHERILLVEDEPLVRRVARDLLEHGGYHVLEAAGGREALEQFTREHAGIGAVILDRSMPDLSGEQVFAQLREIDASVPVIILSGHIQAPEAWSEAAAVLTKPASITALLATVRSAIDQRSRGGGRASLTAEPADA